MKPTGYTASFLGDQSPRPPGILRFGSLPKVAAVREQTDAVKCDDAEAWRAHPGVYPFRSRPWGGAQVASPQSPILRPGPLSIAEIRFYPKPAKRAHRVNLNLYADPCSIHRHRT
jgi:hypothetical protein